MRIEPTKHGDLLYKTDNTTGLFIILSANVGILVHKNGDANQQERTFQPIDGNNYSFHARFPWDSLWAILIFNGTWHLASVPPYIWDVRMYTRGPARFEIWGKNWRLQTWVSVHIALGKGRSVCCMGPRILLVDLIWLLTPIFSVDFRQNQPGKGQIYRRFFFGLIHIHILFFELSLEIEAASPKTLWIDVFSTASGRSWTAATVISGAARVVWPTMYSFLGENLGKPWTRLNMS